MGHLSRAGDQLPEEPTKGAGAWVPRSGLASFHGEVLPPLLCRGVERFQGASPSVCSLRMLRPYCVLWEQGLCPPGRPGVEVRALLSWVTPGDTRDQRPPPCAAPVASCLVAPSRWGKVHVSSYGRWVAPNPAALRLGTPNVRSEQLRSGSPAPVSPRDRRHSHCGPSSLH